jgi:hypothetical protein
MTREIRLNAFAMNCTGHMAPGVWRHPRDRSDRYLDLKHWTDLAALLEQGKIDGLFLADVLGTYDVYQGKADAAIRQGIQTPVNDPLLIVSAMAPVTEHLGRGDLRIDLRASLFFCSESLHARSPDQRPIRLERGLRLSGERRPKLRLRSADST